MNKQIDRMMKVIRDQRLEREKQYGRPRSKSFGGKPSTKQDRRNWKKDLDQ
jgi:hypothetical protein